LVNFVRRQVANAVPVEAISAAVNDTASPLWEDDALLAPVLENDPLLYCLGDAVDVEEDDTGGAGDEDARTDDAGLEIVGRAVRLSR
jgi:hypothetical protein